MGDQDPIQPAGPATIGGHGRVALVRELALALSGVVVELRRVARDRRAPLRHRLALMALVPYLASPIDLVPDFIPVVGMLDDALIAALVVGWVVRGVDHHLLAEHWSDSPLLGRLLRQDEQDDGGP